MRRVKVAQGCATFVLKLLCAMLRSMFDEARQNRSSSSRAGRTYLSLQDSEVAVLDAASRIYAAYISAGIAEGSESDTMRKAIHEAITLAKNVESILISDGEV